jgi:thiol-disulfide isomerase/thioredoxin
MLYRIVLASALAAIFLAACGHAADDPKPDAAKQEVAIGDAAPSLQVQEFVKGEPVKQFEKGKIYVVEFWATWCAPCRESIPHLTKLQQENKGVTFIGVSIDEETGLVKPFVDKMGDKMDYRVAIDAREGGNARMAQAWLEASGQEGIPAAFVVDGDGRVAWLGHPGDLEQPLVQIVAGKWDLVAKAAEYKKAKAQERALAKVQDDLGLLLRRKEYAEAAKLLDKAAKDFELSDELVVVQVALLGGPGNDSAGALPIATRLFEKAANEQDAGTLMMLANALADPQSFFPGGSTNHHPLAKVDSKLAEVAVKAAEKAESLAHSGNAVDDAETAMVVAKAYRAAGENAKAAEKLDTAAKLVNESIQSANDTLAEIGKLKASLGGATGDSTAPQKLTEKLKSAEK